MKPDTVSQTMKLFIAPPDETSKTVRLRAEEDKTTYTQDSDHTMLKISIELQELSIKLIHQRTLVCMAELAISHAAITVEKKPLSTHIAIILGNVQLFDTNNYPNTIDSNLEYEKVVPYEMLGVGEPSKNLLEFKMDSYNPAHPLADNPNKLFNHLDIKISSIRINYLQQSLFRLIDYIQWQLLPAVRPYKYDLVLIGMPKHIGEQNLDNIQFMDIKIHIQAPILTLKPLPTSTNYIEIRLDDISLQNGIVKDSTRFKNPCKPLDFVYCETYDIKLNGMGIYKIDGENTAQISKKTMLGMKLERTLMYDEYVAVYSDGQPPVGSPERFSFDMTMKINGRIAPIIMLLQRDDYLLLMRCVFFNIQYDDVREKLFVSNISMEFQNQGRLATPLDINIVFENFTLLAFKQQEEHPFSMINFHEMNLGIKRDGRKNTNIQITARELNGSYFENEDGENLVERKMMGALDKVNLFPIKDLSNENIVESILNSTKTYTEEISMIHSMKGQKKDQLSIILQMQPTGDKVIRITINELKMYLVTSTYINLAGFFRMNDSVYPPSRLLQMKQGNNGPNQQPQATLTFTLETKNILITVPSTILKNKDTPNVLALKGDLSFVFARYPAPSLEESIEDVTKRNFNRATEQCAQFNEVSRMSVSLNKFEIFVCEFADLLNTMNFNQVKKRNMVLPFSLLLVKKNHHVVNKQRTQLISVTKNEINVERLIFRLSYQDVNLLANSFQYQKEQLQKAKENQTPEENTIQSQNPLPPLPAPIETKFEETKENFSQASQEPQPQPQLSYDPDDWVENLQEFNIASKGFQVVLINDVEGALVPVLEFTIFELLTTMIKAAHKLKMDAKLVMNCSYFNPLPSKWEPFVEKFGLNIHFAKGDNPKTTLLISSSEEFEEINLNVSEEMLGILYSTINTWKEDYQQRKNIIQGKSMIMNSKLKEENVIEYVSPYRIINYTGYPVEIHADISSQKTTKTRKGSTQIQESYYVENGGQAQYLVESDIDKIFERSNDDMSTQTNKIRVRFKHPKYELASVTGIDIDRPNVTGFPLTIRHPSSTDIKFSLYTSVKIEQSKKIITLTSPYHITNNVFRAYIITFESETGQKLEVRLDKGETTAVPIDFVKGSFSLRLDAPEAHGSDKIPVEAFAKLGDKTLELRADWTSFALVKSTKIDPACDFYEISLLPPFEVKNCCGLDLYYRFSNTTETIMETSTLKPQETLHETKLPSEQHVYLQIRLQGYYWSEKFLVHSSDSRNKLSKEVQVMDASGKLLNILVFTPQNELGSRKLLLYTKTCIVNETPFDIFCYECDDKKMVQIPGQLPTDSKELFNSKITLYNEINTMAFGKKKQKEYSAPVNVGTMGSTATELVSQNGGSMLDIGISMSLLRCDKTYNLFTKIITISPRFILLNKTDYVLEIKRDCSQQTMGIISKNIRTPYYWSNWDASMKDKSICMRPIESVDEPDKWSWSNGFDIQAIGLYNYLVFGKDHAQTKFFKTSVSLEFSTIFVVIEEEKIENLTFKIRNECPDIELNVWQAGSGSYLSQIVKPGETMPWAWAYPNMKKEISAAFVSENFQTYYDSQTGFSFDSLNTTYKIRIPVDREQVLRVGACIVVEGSTRILKFFVIDDRRLTPITSSPTAKQVNFIEEIINMNVEVAIKGLGISIISSLTAKKQERTKERREVLYILLRGIDFRMINSNTMKYSQLRLKFLNIDNNTSYDTSFPVLMTPTKPKDLESGTKNYFLDTLIVQRVTPEVTFYETVQLLLDASTIQVDGVFIDAIIEVVQRFREVLGRLDESDSKRTIAQILYNSTQGAKKLQRKDYFETKFDWANRQLSEFAGGNLYIKKLILNALFFNVSFQFKKKDAGEDGFFLLNLFTSVLGTTLANLDNAPLTLSGIVLENVFDSKQAIKKKIIEKYKDEATKSIPKLIGSLDIVGNPVGLFNNISTGVVDLVEKPMQGFLQGPLEGSMGIVMGTGSLLKNTVSGTFNSIGKVTGSLASGLSNLTMDDDYLAQREKIKLRRPKHIGEGVAQGFSSLLMGVGEGIAGVFTKPVEGATKGGLVGFFKGAFQGVTGLVVKPVAGILDAAANTAEGIKNTATAFDQKPNEERMRYPRVFYGKHKYYRTYADTDAEAMWFLHFSHDVPQRFKNISILHAFDVVPEKEKPDEGYLLIISFEIIIWWSLKEEKALWAVETGNLEKVIQYNGGLIFQLKQATEKFKDRQVDVKNSNALQNTFVYKKLAELAEYVKH